MIFLHKCLQCSQFLLVALIMFAGAVFPKVALRAETDFRELESGVYLYGQSSKPYEIGNEYILLEVREEQLVGVLYMPHSSFSCFEGEIVNNQLEMTVDHPYDDTVHDYAIALEETSPIASRNQQGQVSLQLQGYVPVEEINANDRRMLATCREKF